ncbi:hypothetical protein GCM10029992_48320 [Glycomyces albus]
MPLAMAETGLTEPRLRAELKRTAVQLRLFADTIVDGAYLDARIDRSDPEFALGPRPDVRRVNEPVGPVLNFAAGNFPFAFSVAGGDTASALAAGNPVIVKAHPGHPRLSARTAEIVAAALERAGLPAETLQLIEGREAGVAMLEHPLVKAAAFTGSIPGGQFLAGWPPRGRSRSRSTANSAASTPSSSPEASSPSAPSRSCPGWSRAWPAPPGSCAPNPVSCSSRPITGSTRPSPRPLAGRGASDARSAYRSRIRGAARGDPRRPGGPCRRRGLDPDRCGRPGLGDPTIAAVGLDALRGAFDALRDECFGPLAILVEVPAGTEYADLLGEFFDGNLTVTVHRTEADDVARLVRAAARHAGRVLFDGWPTGVAVTPAMQHGGPWPATTAGGTSVGTAAIARFVQAVAYQNAPADLLPPPVRDDNPWGVPQTIAPAGESADWGSRAAN